ncbi:MAG: PAS domain S-box protein [Geminicoccaceae bacterium]|nr:PAS domain S-box protein [Geminicoccaceae bacterium]
MNLFLQHGEPDRNIVSRPPVAEFLDWFPLASAVALVILAFVLMHAAPTLHSAVLFFPALLLAGSGSAARRSWLALTAAACVALTLMNGSWHLPMQWTDGDTEPLLTTASLLVVFALTCRQVAGSVKQRQVLLDTFRSLEDKARTAERYQARLRSVLRAVDGYWERETDSDEVYWSDGIFRLFGLEPGVFTPNGDRIRSLLHPDDVSRFDETFRRHISEGQEYRAELRIRQPDGSYRWILSVGIAELGDDGTPRHFYGTAINIDPIKRAEDARLRAQEEADASRQRLEIAIESLDDGFALYDEADRIVVCNRRFLEIHPYGDGASPVGLTYEEHLRDAISKGYLSDARGREEEWIAQRLHQHRNPDGNHIVHLADGRWIRLSERRTPTGETVGIRSDITALKQAQDELATNEQRLRLILDAVTDGHFEHNMETGEEYWSPGIYDVLDIDREQVAHPRHHMFIERVHANDRDKIEQALSRHVEHGDPYRVEMRIRRNNGEYRWVESKGRVLRRPDGRPFRLIGATNDIDAFKKAEEQRLMHQAEAERFRRQFIDAVESMQDGFALYDAQDRMVMCNRHFRKIFEAAGDIFKPGTTYYEQIRAGVMAGLIKEAIGCEEEWLAARMSSDNRFDSSLVQRLADGRWLQISDRKTSDGGTVALRIDITQLKLTQERLASSERRFRDYADATSDWFWESGLDHRFTFVSARFPELANRPLREVAGVSQQRSDTDVRDRLALSRIEKAMSERKPFREVRLTRYVDGDAPIHMHLSGKPVFDADERFVGYRGAGTDISLIVAMEEKQATAELQLVRAVESLPLLFALFDKDDRLLISNPRFREVFDITSDPAVHEYRYDILMEHFACNRLAGNHRSRNTWLANRRNRRLKPAIRFEFQYDDDRWMSTSDFPIPDGSIIWLAIDITDIRRAEALSHLSEQRLRTIFDAAPDGIINIDDNGRIGAFSRFAENMFGVTEADVVETMIDRFMPVDDTDSPFGRWWMNAPAEISQLEVRARRADGSLFPAILSVVTTSIGDQPGFTVFISDITELRKRDDALRQAQKMEAIGQLTGGVAHDFNNLLTAILGNIEMLEPRVQEREDLLPMIDDLKAAATLGADLVSRLLAFSRRSPLQSRTIDLGATIADLVPLLSRTLGSKIDIETELVPGTPKVRVDPTQMRNAVINLAINARDAMPRGGHLLIRTAPVFVSPDRATRHEVPAGRYGIIEIADTGTGIDPDEQQRVFEPFYTSKESGRGTGLGLSMVYGFARQSGGFVTLESLLGEGTRIFVWLPEARGPDETAKEAERATGIEQLPRGDGETVLVLEDDPLVRRVTVSCLEQLDYVVFEAANGEEAIELLDMVPENGIILSDVMMPGGLSAMDLIVEAERQRPDLLVLLVSGYIDQEQVDTGNRPLLRKPFTTEALALFIRSALDTRNSNATDPERS